MRKNNMLYIFCISAYLCLSLQGAAHQAEHATELEKKEKYQLFAKEFGLKETTTEKSNEITANLSESFKKDPLEGLKLLHTVDQIIIPGIRHYQSTYFETLYTAVKESLQRSGRLMFVGAGSSGRIGVDLAAKWKQALANISEYPKFLSPDSVVGIIAGGARAFVRAKEGFEDSEESGRESLQPYSPHKEDIIILLSASGSAKFNVGAGIAAHEAGARVYYFYNSQSIPARTQDLFLKYGVNPILVDTGPQAICGSTRLQAASLAEFVLGGTLNALFLDLVQHSTTSPRHVFDQMIENLERGNQQIQEQFPVITNLIQKETAILSSPEANFYRLRDETAQGYITFLSGKSATREIMIDTTETPPTFSTNPPRFTYEKGRKEAELRAYLLGSSNINAWKDLIGQKVNEKEIEETQTVLIATNEEGFGGYLARPQGKGNMLIGVVKSPVHREEVNEILVELKKAKAQGANTGFIALTELNKLPKEILEDVDIPFIMTPNFNGSADPLAVVPTVIIKQVLNMLSNGTMIGMNKIYGNVMIDLAASNNKLIDRTIRIIQSIYQKEHPELPLLDEENLFYKVIEARDYKNRVEREENIYVPPVVRIVKTMTEDNCSPAEAVAVLRIYESARIQTQAATLGY